MIRTALARVVLLLVFPLAAFAAPRPEVTEGYRPLKVERPNKDLGIGATGGFPFVLPFLHFQHALSPQVAVGLQGLFSDAISGAFFTGLYTLRRGPFSTGPYLSGGIGAYLISARSTLQSEGATAAAVYVSMGWRFRLGDSLRLGVSAGGQFVNRLAMPQLSTSLNYVF